MAWASLPDNQVVTFDNLKEACDYGYLLPLLPLPPTGLGKKCIRAELIQSYVEIEPGPLEGTPANQTVIKGKIVGKKYVYYQLQGCGSDNSAIAWTRIPPETPYQRYYLATSYPPKAYYATMLNTTPAQIQIPFGYNGSIQRSGVFPYETYCPPTDPGGSGGSGGSGGYYG